MGETAGRGTAAGRTRRSAPFTFAMAASSQPPRAARSLLAVLLVTFGVSFVLYFDGVAKLRRNSIALEKVTDLPNFSKFSSFRSNRGATTAAAPPAAAGPTEPSPTCYHLRRVAVPGWQSCVMHCALPFISQIDAPQHAQRHVGGAVHAAEVAFPALRDLFRNVHLSQWQRQRSSTVDDRMPKRGVGAAIPPSLPPPPSNRVYIIDIAPKSLPLTNIWHWLVVVAPLYRWLRENLDAGVAMDTITIHFPLLEGLEPDSWQAGMLDLVRIAASASAPSPSRAAIAFGHTLDDRPALVTWTNAAATNTFFCRNALFYAADARAAAQLRAAADAEWPPPLPSPTPALASSAAPPLSTIGAFNKVVFLLRGNRDGSKSGEVHGSGRALINVNALVEFARQWTIRNGATLVVAYTAEHGSFVDQIELFRSARVVISVHGAQLANVMWMRPKVGFLIELLPHTFVPTTYAELCEQFDVGYRAVPSFTRWRSGRRVRARPACTDFECHHFVRQDDVFIAPPALVAALQHAVKPPRAENGTSTASPPAVEAQV